MVRCFRSVEAAMEKRDIYEQVTTRIVEAIEEGAGDWQMPWHRSNTSRPINARSGRAYHGINVLTLWVTAEAERYSSGYWATYRQWQDLKAQVRKGEKASLVVFWKQTDLERENVETGERETKQMLLARASWAFNADQVAGWIPPAPKVRGAIQVLADAEIFVSRTVASIQHGGDRAFYRPSADEIHMPERDRFVGSPTSSATEAYYSTLLHELTHWTGHESRLARDLTGRFGDHAYAMEELVAELGAAFLCADLAITNVPRADHAAYIANWLEVLRSDKRAVFTAASKASAASDYLFSLQARRVAP